jgi:hypothetical protein
VSHFHSWWWRHVIDYVCSSDSLPAVGKAGYCFDGHIDLHPSITRMRGQHRLHADEGASEDDYEEITCQVCAGVPVDRPIRQVRKASLSMLQIPLSASAVTRPCDRATSRHSAPS